ncbi:hypothetical protein QBC36DRAFT_169453, partial [Triangularia setosa]
MTNPNKNYNNAQEARLLYGPQPENYSDLVAQARDPVEKEEVESEREDAQEVRKKLTAKEKERKRNKEREKAEQARASNHKTRVPYTSPSYIMTS